MRSTRPFFAALLLLCAALLGFGLYLQFHRGLAPCPLCIFQRLAYMGVGVVALLGLLQGPRSRGWVWSYGGALALLALVGAGVAGRQVWLQHLPPDQVPSCGPGLNYMLSTFPLSQTLRMVFTGSGECAEVHWTFLTLSIAEWSLIWFLLIIAAALVYAARRRT